MHIATRFACIYSPRRPELMRRVDLYRMLAAFRFPDASETYTYFDDARGLALGAVVPEGSALPGWWSAEDAAIAADGRVRLAHGVVRGPEAARAVHDALTAGAPLPDLAGEFGFIHWDGGNGSITAGSDPYGRSSVYYSQPTFGLLLAASEAKSILEHPAGRREASPEGMAIYLRDGAILAPYTAYEGMYRLGSGELLRFGMDADLQRWFTWQFPPISSESRSLQEWGADVGARVRQDILDASAGQDTTGVLFSAGFDSSLIVGVLHEAGRKLRGYTASYPSAFRSRPSDYPFALQTAEALGFPCDEVMVRPETALPLLAEVLQQFDQPNVQVASMITFRMLLAAARNHGIQIALSGMGAEEAYGIDFWKKIRDGFADGSLTGDADVTTLASEPSFFSDEVVRDLTGVDSAAVLAASIAPYEALANSTDAYDHIRRAFLWTIRRARLLDWTESLAVIDPVEVRHPFNEWRTLQFVETIPSEFKGAKGEDGYKALLKQPFDYLIPRWVRERDNRGLPDFVISEYRFEALEKLIFDKRFLDATGLFAGKDLEKPLRKRQLRKLLTWLLLWHDIHISRRQESLDLLSKLV